MVDRYEAQAMARAMANGNCELYKEMRKYVEESRKLVELYNPSQLRTALSQFVLRRDAVKFQPKKALK